MQIFFLKSCNIREYRMAYLTVLIYQFYQVLLNSWPFIEPSLFVLLLLTLLFIHFSVLLWFRLLLFCALPFVYCCSLKDVDRYMVYTYFLCKAQASFKIASFQRKQENGSKSKRKKTTTKKPKLQTWDGGVTAQHWNANWKVKWRWQIKRVTE